MAMKRRKLTAIEIAKADEMALDYMRKQADTMERFDGHRPTDEQVEAAAAKCAEATKRLWRLQDGPVV